LPSVESETVFRNLERLQSSTKTFAKELPVS